MHHGSIIVDIKTVDDFRLALIPLVQQATDALNGLTEIETPRLGAFQDAVLTGEHHQALRADFMARLRRLAWDLVEVRNASEAAVTAYDADAQTAPVTVAAMAVPAAPDQPAAPATETELRR